jgi:serine/threonine protein phosphatase 1
MRWRLPSNPKQKVQSQVTRLSSKRVVTYAVADIHGRLDLLRILLDMITADAAARGARAKIVFTGDYMDRGRDSYGVVERLIAGPARDEDVFLCLRGNHDDLFVRSVTTGSKVPDWAWFLFDHTIESYKVDTDGVAMSDRLRRHVDFISTLPLTHDDGKYLFVHAGIRPNVSLADQEEQDLLWIREEFLDYAGPLPRRIVHGHTIIGDRPIFAANRISADTGAFRSGFLTAIVLDKGEESFLQAVGEPDDGAIERERVLTAAMLSGSLPANLDRRPGFLRATMTPTLVALS